MQTQSNVLKLNSFIENPKQEPEQQEAAEFELLGDEINSILEPEAISEPIPVFRGADGYIKPVRMECERFAPGLKTTCGDTMHINSHFLSEEDAWKAIVSHAEAGVSMAGRDVMQAEGMLADAQENAAYEAKQFMLTMQNFDHWKSGR